MIGFGFDGMQVQTIKQISAGEFISGVPVTIDMEIVFISVTFESQQK